ncbi:hypothetical protein GCM10010168_86170 [Actinoplanes ianthinogenes]|uniref:Uncharacterized protein n=1 Tax=Actinoplanes ianthinogenes TaxID=122358 RepID=A0ABN6CK34_9ACTN|nr:hypothetical protein [Actinoplanes ianthinogenes]BCJ45348.1 hypothetical protein Aiant_60050 [Actinoplanes ianthinogenes]GGR53937.1 hypothetical protein GCM10010168_86170 [Actinoplanes ianthinogenes]
MLDFTAAAFREAALRMAVDTVDPETQPTAAEVIGMAQEFEAYLRGDEQPEAETASAKPEQSDPCDCPSCTLRKALTVQLVRRLH